MPLALASHVTSRQAAQFGIDQRDQFLQRLLVPITPGSEELRNFLGDGSHRTYFYEACRCQAPSVVTTLPSLHLRRPGGSLFSSGGLLMPRTNFYPCRSSTIEHHILYSLCGEPCASFFRTAPSNWRFQSWYASSATGQSPPRQHVLLLLFFSLQDARGPT